MDTLNSNGTADLMPEKLLRRRRIFQHVLVKRTRWLVRLRWWVPPTILAGTLAAQAFGYQFAFAAMYLLAVIIFLYNLVFYFVLRQYTEEDLIRTRFIRYFTFWQAGMDFGALLYLVHFTGGAASPFIFFFILHIIHTSMLLPRRWAYIFGGLVSAGMVFVAAGEYSGWIPHHALYYNGSAIDLAARPAHLLVELAFFIASVFASVYVMAGIQQGIRHRAEKLAALSEESILLNQRFHTLVKMRKQIEEAPPTREMLDRMIEELTRLLGVQAVSIKLVSLDRKSLRLVTSSGLPADGTMGADIALSDSRIGRQVVGGEAFMQGETSREELNQLGLRFEQPQLRSVLYVPVRTGETVTGVLGAYSTAPDQFRKSDVEFFHLAAAVLSRLLEKLQG